MSLSNREKVLFVQVAHGRGIMALDPLTGW